MSLVFVILSVLTLSTAYSTCRNAIIMNINRGISPQATWGLFKQKPRATVKDVVSVLGRFEKREDFYEGRGYARPEKGLLTKEMFYENISKKQFKRWPISPKGIKVGVENSSPEEIKRLEKELSASPPSKAGADAIFTSFAKGAENGVAYPKQVEEEMQKWYTSDGVFDLGKFESTLFFGRIYVFIGWFLYIGLQFGGVYVVFFAPIMSQFFPNVDFYPVQTFLHTSEWGK